MQKGRLYLIPTSLGNNDLRLTIPFPVFEIINSIDDYIVESTKTAVGFLKQAGILKKPQMLSFCVLNIDTKDKDINEYLNPALEGKHVGLISEAGVPCVADPGAKIVSLAHEMGIKVIPLVGPSSIILALMASGLNGQEFTFNGYLPIDKDERKTKLHELQKIILSKNQTQIFIEAPHRNDKLVADILNYCSGEIKLCIGVDLTLPTESITTLRVSVWKKQVPQIGKNPAIFLLGK